MAGSDDLVDEVIALVRMLHQSKPTRPEIQEHLSISRATFYRHIARLRDTLGMRVSHSEGRYQIDEYGLIDWRKL